MKRAFTGTTASIIPLTALRFVFFTEGKIPAVIPLLNCMEITEGRTIHSSLHLTLQAISFSTETATMTLPSGDARSYLPACTQICRQSNELTNDNFLNRRKGN